MKPIKELISLYNKEVSEKEQILFQHEDNLDDTYYAEKVQNLLLDKMLEIDDVNMQIKMSAYARTCNDFLNLTNT
jgi:hypothetical protein